MYLSELQDKSIVTVDGKLVGNIIDVFINDGKIDYLIVEKSNIKLVLSKKTQVKVFWKDIKVVGDDMIIVNCLINDNK